MQIATWNMKHFKNSNITYEETWTTQHEHMKHKYETWKWKKGDKQRNMKYEKGETKHNKHVLKIQNAKWDMKHETFFNNNSNNNEEIWEWNTKKEKRT